MPTSSHQYRQMSYAGTGLVLGAGLGVVAGAVFGGAPIALGLAIGAGVGVVIGAVVELTSRPR